MSDLVINVRQISQYPQKTQVAPNDAILLQSGGIGGPNSYATPANLMAAFSPPGGSSSQIGIGVTLPADATNSGVIASQLTTPLGCTIGWNWYRNAAGIAYLAAGQALQECFDGTTWSLNASTTTGTAGTTVPGWNRLFGINAITGNATLAGTLTLAPATSGNQAVTQTQLQAAVAAAVTSFNGRTGAVVLTPGDISSANGALLASPGFSGVPTAPTAAVNTNTQQLATTQFVMTQFNSILNLNVGNQATVSNALLVSPVAGFPPNLAQGSTISSNSLTAGSGSVLFNAYYDASANMHYLNTGVAYGWLPGATNISLWAAASGAANAQIVGVAQSWGFSLTDGRLTTTQVVLGRAPTAAMEAANMSWVQSQIAAAVVSFNGRTGAVSLTTADISGAGGALLASPVFTGVPTAPTAAPGNSTAQIATTAYVMAAVTSAVTGVVSFNTRTGAVTLTQTDITTVGAALINSPGFTGTPTAPTPTTGDNSTRLATTAFVMAEVAAISAGVTTWNTRSGNVVMTTADITGAGGAPVASPALTGTPTAPTAAPSVNTAQIATCAFVNAAVGAAVTSFNGRTGAITLTSNDLLAAGGALLASPQFTGSPTAPTAPPGTSTTQLATTAFVMTQLGAGGVVNTFNGRTGTVALLYTDLTAVNGALIQVQPTAPSGAPYPIDNQLWWNSANTQLYIRYFDGTNHQWVQANSSSGPPPSTTVPLSDSTPGVVGTSSAYARADHQHTANLAWAGDVGRNLLHNSMFNIQQRGAGPFTTISGAYTADRWATGGALDTISWQAGTVADADRAAIGDEAAQVCWQNTFTGNAGATAYNELAQRIEKVFRLSNKTVTVSFYAIASVALRVGLNLSQVFGTGGTPSGPVNVLATGITFNVTTAWARYSATIAIPSAAGKVFGTNGDDYTMLRLAFSSGATNNAFFGNVGVQSGTVKLWGVQLEIAQSGQTAPTPLEKLDPVLQLQQCQRFYTVLKALAFWGYQVSGNNIGNAWALPVTMRTGATVTLSGTTTSGLNPPTTGVTYTTLQIAAVSSITGANSLSTDAALSADL